MQEPIDAKYIEPITGTFYKKEGCQWYIWSRIEKEPMHWCKAFGISLNCLMVIKE